MKVLSKNMAVLTFAIYVVLVSGGLSGCAQSNISTGKPNFSNADLEKFRWMEGSWRGSEASGKNPFFERYRFVGNAKIEIDSFSDATLSKVDNQSSIYVENGELIYQNGKMRWKATKLDGSVMEFAPKEKTTDPFAWTKESTDAWTARLAGKDAQGSKTETIYRLERIKQ
jgi:hypothetical protein